MARVISIERKNGVFVEKRFYSRSRSVFMKSENDPLGQYIYKGTFCCYPRCVTALGKTCKDCRHNLDNQF